MMKRIVCAGVVGVLSSVAMAQESDTALPAVPGLEEAAPALDLTTIVDVSQILQNCNAAPETCQQLIQAAIAEVQATEVPLTAAQTNALLGQLATVAVSVAQQHPEVSQDLGDALTQIANNVAPAAEGETFDLASSLQESAEQVSSGEAETVDLNAVAGSPA